MIGGRDLVGGRGEGEGGRGEEKGERRARVKEAREKVEGRENGEERSGQGAGKNE